MTKQDYTVYIYKADKRTTIGKRLVYTFVLQARPKSSIAREVKDLADTYPSAQGYHLEFTN
jgi:hypothetical protein